MHPHDCPPWEYKDIPGFDAILGPRSNAFLIRLRRGQIVTDRIVRDTRPEHENLFRDLTPAGHPYFAGHYRGEDFHCLEECPAGVSGDPSVGYPAAVVGQAILDFAAAVLAGLTALDRANELPDAVLAREDKVLYVIRFSSRVLVEFLTVHPFANGNGHISRLLVWTVLGRYQFWPKRWPLNRRPPDPPFSTLLTLYRAGNKDALEQFVMKCVLGQI
jgi:hypothetical protein